MNKKLVMVLTCLICLCATALVSIKIGMNIAARNKQQTVITVDPTEGDTTDYALAHEITNNAEAYYGTEIALRGYYSNSAPIEQTSSETEASGQTSSSKSTVYHFITVFDKYKDCYVTLEFTSPNGKYPAIGDFIRVSGVFGKYNDGDSQYLTITASKVEKIS